MKKIVRIALRVILGLLAVLLLGLALLITFNWDTVQILKGTKNLGLPSQEIPEVRDPSAGLRQKGESDWPRWRGPNGDAASSVTSILKDWSKGLALQWQIDYLCQGPGSAAWSAPVVQGDHLVVCGRSEDKDLIFCLNANTGNLLWPGQYRADSDSDHGMGMRATPAIDQDRVYSFGRAGDLVCWALADGAMLWRKNVSHAGGQSPKWGHSSSPLVTDQLVLVQGGGTARTIAYDKLTGEIVWTSGQGDAGYAALVTMTIGDTRACLAFHGTGLAAMDLATGAELWDTPWPTRYGVNATTPLVHEDKIFITSGYGTGGQLLQVTPTNATGLWTHKRMAAHHTDGHIIDGYLYGYSGQSIQNRGTFKCLDLATGAEKWSTKAMGWGTSVAVEDHLLCLDIKGNLFLMKPDPEAFQQVTALPEALGDVEGPVWTVPVIANDKLYLRFKQRLVCYLLKD